MLHTAVYRTLRLCYYPAVFTRWQMMNEYLASSFSQEVFFFFPPVGSFLDFAEGKEHKNGEQYYWTEIYD